MLGREKYLENIAKQIPEHFDVINNGHTLFIDTKLMSKSWDEFKWTGVSTKKLDFIKLRITINEQEVLLDKKTRHYFPYPNKSYLTFGHQHNKNGLLIEINDEVWNKINKDGYFNLRLSYSLLDGKNEREKTGLIIHESIEENENRIVTYANLNMKINVLNVNKGNHLVIQTGEYGLCNPIAFFSEKDYSDFKEYRNSYILDKGLYCPVEIDSSNKDRLWWGFNQTIEINIEPYDIYYVNEKKDRECFNFFNIVDSYTIKENPSYYKVVGKINNQVKMNKAIRINYETKSVYFIELDISTYDKKIESIKKELKADELELRYLPTGEIVFMDLKDTNNINMQRGDIVSNVVIAGNSPEDINLSVEYLKELLLPNMYQFSDEVEQDKVIKQ